MTATCSRLTCIQKAGPFKVRIFSQCTRSTSKKACRSATSGQSARSRPGSAMIQPGCRQNGLTLCFLRSCLHRCHNRHLGLQRPSLPKLENQALWRVSANLFAKPNRQSPGTCGGFSELRKNMGSTREDWLGRQGSNLGMAESKSAALPLGYAPAAGSI